MEYAGIILFGLFFFLLFLRTPIAVALGLASIAVIWLANLGVGIVPYNFYAGIAKFPLLAIPFFILAGGVMQKAGMAERLVRLIGLLMGRIRGGLAYATVITALLWGALSGSGPATVAALGLIIIPTMSELGYGKPFATALISACAELAIIIPPSIAFIIYAALTNVSVGAQFMAGIIPGIVVGLFYIATCFIVARQRGYGGEQKATLRELGQAFAEAFWGLLTPVIILGGIYGGIFTPTEAAAVACVYGFFVGFVVYRTLDLRKTYELLVETAISSAVVMIVVTWAGLFSWTAASIGIVDQITLFILSLSANKILFLAIINVFLLILGCMLDAISIYYLTLPIFIPVMQHLGWDPIWFGVIMTVNLAIGQITPPVAVNLYVGARISRLNIEEIWSEAWRFALAAIGALLLITYIPELSLWLPRLLGMLGR